MTSKKGITPMLNIYTLDYTDYESRDYDDWIDEFGEYHCGCGCYEGGGGEYCFDTSKFYQLHEDVFQVLLATLQARVQQVS